MDPNPDTDISEKVEGESIKGSSVQRIDNTFEGFDPVNTVNINVGILGHVDSGKTSLSKALSTIKSTAAFDKNPQSQERGITLDLGFSAFLVHAPGREKEFIQFTLVDCPGHASLMKTVIQGASIIDYIILVIDSTKGIQTQTSECIVLAELLGRDIIIALNKVDQIPEEKREQRVKVLTQKFKQTFNKLGFGPDVPIAPISAVNDEGIDEMLETILDRVVIPERDINENFLFSVDHCFQIKGKGSVMTGTVLGGKVKVGDEIEIPSIGETKKVKSMQMFKQPVQYAQKGDRIGICVTKLESKKIERATVTSPGSMPMFNIMVAEVTKIKYYKSTIKSKSKFHITVGNQTAIGQALFFKTKTSHDDEEIKCEGGQFDFDQTYLYSEELIGKKSTKRKKLNPSEDNEETKESTPQDVGNEKYYALITLDRPQIGSEGAMMIGSTLDNELNKDAGCRFAFHGKALRIFFQKDKTIPQTSTKQPKGGQKKQKGKQEVEEQVEKQVTATSNLPDMPQIKIGKMKSRSGQIDMVQSKQGIQTTNQIIISNMFTKNSDITNFKGMKVQFTHPHNEEIITGKITGMFGKSGKCKVQLDSDINAKDDLKGVEVLMPFMKLMFDKTNQMLQEQ